MTPTSMSGGGPGWMPPPPIGDPGTGVYPTDSGGGNPVSSGGFSRGNPFQGTSGGLMSRPTGYTPTYLGPPVRVNPGGFGGRMPPPPIGPVGNQFSGWQGYMSWLQNLQQPFVRNPGIGTGPVTPYQPIRPNWWLPPPQIGGLG